MPNTIARWLLNGTIGLVFYDLSLHVINALGFWSEIGEQIAPHEVFAWLSYSEWWISYWGLVFLSLLFVRVEWSRHRNN